jgi:hypothetical protein
VLGDEVIQLGEIIDSSLSPVGLSFHSSYARQNRKSEARSK